MSCKFHPERPQEYTCEACAAPLCHDCGVDILGHVYCLQCKEEVLRSYERGETIDAGAARGPSPFENRREIGFFSGLIDTLRESMFRPQEFFGRIEPEANLGDAVLYGVIVAGVAGAIGQAWQIAFGDIFQRLTPFEARDAEFATIQRTMNIIFLFAMPIVILVYGFIQSALYHLALLLVGGAQRGFAATARAVFYGYGATVWSAIPFCGGFIAGLWTLIITIIGIQKLHDTALWKAIVAYFLPLVVCVCGALLPFVILLLMRG
ncbi:MAG: YIP1 family protein [Planctomycetes bacterium]|nr:YIP1 family protein [Planctomycetota bacterium]